MARIDPHFRLRIPSDLLQRLAADATANNRSTTAEIVARLEASSNPQPLTPAMLADALGCFWNAAIGASHRQQDGVVFAGIMAEGFAAVASRLNEQSKPEGGAA